jgi:hypothetical protein
MEDKYRNERETNKEKNEWHMRQWLNERNPMLSKVKCRVQYDIFQNLCLYIPIDKIF